MDWGELGRSLIVDGYASIRGLVPENFVAEFLDGPNTNSQQQQQQQQHREKNNDTAGHALRERSATQRWKGARKTIRGHIKARGGVESSIKVRRARLMMGSLAPCRQVIKKARMHARTHARMHACTHACRLPMRAPRCCCCC